MTSIFYRTLTIFILFCFILTVHTYAAEKTYTSNSSVSLKTQLLMAKYPEIHKRVDTILEKVYTKIQTRSLRIQKLIYIRLQERISIFKEKYEERNDIIILLNYINESVGVQLYRTDKKILEQERKETQQDILPETEKTPVSPTEKQEPQTSKIENTERIQNQNTLETSNDTSPINNIPEAQTQEEESTEVSGDDSVQLGNSNIVEDSQELDTFSTDPLENTPNPEPSLAGEQDEQVEDSGTNIAGLEPLEGGGSSPENIIQITPPPLPGQESPSLEEDDLLNEITVIEEEEQTLQINEIGRFVSTVSVEIESMTLVVIGDRNFVFPNNILYIRNEQGETLDTSIAYRSTAENLYEFDFINTQLPQELILLQADVFSVESDANTEVTIKSISIPENLDIENALKGKKLLSKDRIDLSGENSTTDDTFIMPIYGTEER